MLVFVGKSTGKIIDPYLNGTSIGFSYSCIFQYELCILTGACGARILLRIDSFTAFFLHRFRVSGIEWTAAAIYYEHRDEWYGK